MSARSVCSGTRPSRYHSVRAISEPPRRPEHWTRMPRAPAFWAFCTARFMARRKATRSASWSATPWAISAASSSGCLISWMFSWTLGLPVILVRSARSSSASAPRRPMTMPGTGGVHVDAQAVTGALDLDAADRRVRELVHEVVADLPVLDDVVDVLLTGGEPAGLPLGGDTEAEAVGIDLLTHQSSFFSVSRRRRPSTRPRSAASSASGVGGLGLGDLLVVGGSAVVGLVGRLGRLVGRPPRR